MPESSTQTTTVTPAQTAANIVGAIQDKAKGAAAPSPAIPAKVDKNGAQPPAVVDPNAGKERYVVEGKEVWLTPEQARSYVQKGLAFEPRMDDLARLRQETIQLQNAILNDPGSVLANIAKRANIPLSDMVKRVLSSNASPEVKESVGKWFYEEAVEPSKMTPEQLKARENEKWRTERENKDRVEQENAIKRENQAKVESAMNQIKANIAEAMKESGLPNNDSAQGVMMARRVADVMRLGYFQKQAITPKQAIERVKREMKIIQTAWYDNLDEDQLVAELGEKNAEKVKKYYLKLVKDQNKVGGLNGAANGSEAKPKFKTRDDFFDHLQKIKRGG